METVLYFQERVNSLKKELIEQVENELKSPYLTEFDMIDLGCVVNSHYPDDGCALYYNIECVYLNGETFVCRGHMGEDTSDCSSFDEEAEVFDCETILRILKQIRKIAREIKLAKLRKLVESGGGGKLVFDDSFGFTGDCEGRSNECYDPCDCTLNKLELVNGKLVVYNTCLGEPYDNSTDIIPDYELDRILEYVENESKKVPSIMLTAEQKEAVKELKAAFDKAANLGVECIYDFDNSTISFYNGNNIEDFEIIHGYDCQASDGFVNVSGQLDKCPIVDCVHGYDSFNEELLYVKPKS